MAKLSVELWKALQQLKDHEFKTFKWLLQQGDTSEGRSSISAAQLETADRQDTVDVMAQKYGSTGAIKETMNVLEKISRNDLVQSLQNSCTDPKDLMPQDHDRMKVESKSQQEFPVNVILDPGTSHRNLIASDDCKQVYHGDVRKKLLDSPEMIFRCVCWTGLRITQQEGTNNTET